MTPACFGTSLENPNAALVQLTGKFVGVRRESLDIRVTSVKTLLPFLDGFGLDRRSNSSNMGADVLGDSHNIDLGVVIWELGIESFVVVSQTVCVDLSTIQSTKLMDNKNVPHGSGFKHQP